MLEVDSTGCIWPALPSYCLSGCDKDLSRVVDSRADSVLAAVTVLACRPLHRRVAAAFTLLAWSQLMPCRSIES